MVNQDVPDITEERLTLYDGVKIELIRHSFKVISFKKTHDFKEEQWFLTYGGSIVNQFGERMDPLKPHTDTQINGVKNISSIEEGRSLWSDLLNDGWRRSTTDEIQGVDPAVLALRLGENAQSLSEDDSTYLNATPVPSQNTPPPLSQTATLQDIANLQVQVEVLKNQLDMVKDIMNNKLNNKEET